MTSYDFVFPSAFENRYWLKPFMHKNVKYCNSVTLKIWGCLRMLVKARQP